MKSRKKQETLEFVDKRRDAIIGFLRKLLSFPSITGAELEIQNFIAGKLRQMGRGNRTTRH
jgi:acetylornithine deacetylase/succinyl-diaminopimelate desuccinylase-like protein